ncbi:MAG: Fe-S biogenesis protein NfuA [Alcanivoracaceae bacterium]|jgi:Fe/S biogenesis protein NfuA|nr:Fe-S biogenesis protein NfuA [Alcanivoracaceae bacterium]
MSEQLISITENAKEYLRDLIEKQGNPGMGVRIFVERPGTPHAECCMAYCPPGEQEENDIRYDYDGFHAWVEGKSVRYLEDASIDFKKDSMGGQLTFRAPKSRVPDIGPEATLEERINHILYAEINPSLASHGGNVQLLELTDENVAILEFGGGCQGCSAVDMTLKSGVEKTLKERIPELTAVRDKTDHSVRDNAYFR